MSIVGRGPKSQTIEAIQNGKGVERDYRHAQICQRNEVPSFVHTDRMKQTKRLNNKSTDPTKNNILIIIIDWKFIISDIKEPFFIFIFK